MNARPFAERNQAARHKFPVGCPEWNLIGWSVNENFNTITKYFLSSPNFNSYPYIASESVPLRTKIPESLRVNNLTTSYVISMGIKISVFSYTSNIEQQGGGVPRKYCLDAFLHNARFIGRQFLR